MATSRLLSVMLSLLPFFGPCSAPLVAQQQPASVTQPYKIKADWLGAFGGYVKWPDRAAPKETFVVGVLGGNAFIERDQTGVVHDYLAELATKTVGGKRIVVRQFKSMDEYEPCHVLFLSAIPAEGRQGEKVEERLNAALQKLQELKTPHVLLVSDTKGMVWKGTAIDFYFNTNMNRVNMLINRDAEKRAGLTISAQVLALRVVQAVTDNEKRDLESN